MVSGRSRIGITSSHFSKPSGLAQNKEPIFRAYKSYLVEC